MAAWWTYSLSDFLLFSSRTYHRLFELYNTDIWPMQLIALALGLAVSVLVIVNPDWQGRVITAIVAASWLWVAWAFHLQRYATINWVAPWFAAGFACQAALLIWTGVVCDRMACRPATPALWWSGFSVLAFALAGQPLLTALSGHDWARAEIFGIAPDPTAIGTLGILLLAADSALWRLLIIPAVWCVISGAVLWTMESPAFFIPPLAAAVAVAFTIKKGAGRND